MGWRAKGRPLRQRIGEQSALSVRSCYISRKVKHCVVQREAFYKELLVSSFVRSGLWGTTDNWSNNIFTDGGNRRFFSLFLWRKFDPFKVFRAHSTPVIQDKLKCIHLDVSIQGKNKNMAETFLRGTRQYIWFNTQWDGSMMFSIPQ